MQTQTRQSRKTAKAAPDPHAAADGAQKMSRELLLVVDAVANEKRRAESRHFRRDGGRAGLGREEALSRAGRRRARRDRSRLGRLRDVPALGSRARRHRHGIAGSHDPSHGRGRREARHRCRRLRRGADREPRIRPHRGAGRQAGHRAARSRMPSARRSSMRTRIASASSSRASSSASSAATSFSISAATPRRSCRATARSRANPFARRSPARLSA